MLEIIPTIIGALIGGSGSALSKWIGIKEKKLSFEHELKLLEMQKSIATSETENELAIAQEETYSDIRAASYKHDMAASLSKKIGDQVVGGTSVWVNNTLRLVRPVLTLLLIGLVWAIWLTIAKDNLDTQNQIIEGVLFMSSAALAWWFGDRSPASKKNNL